MAPPTFGTVQTDTGSPLKAIAVSNGERIVATDAQGRFEIDSDPRLHPFIFATRPDGFGGDRWYAATPQRAGPVRLVLEPPAQRLSRGRTIRIGHITDTHLQSGAGLRSVSAGTRRALHRFAHARGTTVAQLSADLSAVGRICPDLDVIIATGDLTNIGDLPSLRALRRALAASRLPIAPMWAGCDGLFERDALRTTAPFTRHWERLFGPTYYALERGRWLMLIYPNEDRMFGPQRAAMQCRWLKSELARAKAARRPVLVAQHTEIRPPQDGWVRFLAARGVRLLLFGHYHAMRCYEYRGLHVIGTPPLSFGSNDATPRGFRTVQLGRSVGRITFHPIPNGRGSGPPPSPRIRQVWKRTVAGAVHRGRPLVQDLPTRGREVIVPLVDECDRGCAGVLCLDARTGRTQWATPTTHSVRGGPTGWGDLILVATYMGGLLALDRATGKRRWSAALTGYPHRWITSPPVVVGEIAAAGTAFGGIEAFDRHGRRKWRWQYPGGTGDRWPHYGAPAVIGRHIFVKVHRSAVVCLSASSRLLWEFGTHFEHFMAPPLPSAGRLLVPDRDRFHALDPTDGRRLWTRSVSQGVSRRDPGTIVCGWSRDDRLLVLNISTVDEHRPNGAAQARRVGDGRLLWQIEYGRDLLDMYFVQRCGAKALADPLLDGRLVWLGGLDGRLSAVDRDSGRRLATTDLGQPILSLTSIAPHRVMVATYPDDIFCLETDLG